MFDREGLDVTQLLGRLVEARHQPEWPVKARGDQLGGMKPSRFTPARISGWRRVATAAAAPPLECPKIPIGLRGRAPWTRSSMAPSTTPMVYWGFGRSSLDRLARLAGLRGFELVDAPEIAGHPRIIGVFDKC
jgi:hypothetical protein